MNERERKVKMNDNGIPCASNLLWFMSQRMNEERVINVSIDDIMREFNIDYDVANRLISDIANPMGMEFIETLGNDQYRLAESGIEEINFLSRFVRVSSKRKVNPRNAVRISVKLREWLRGMNPQNVSKGDANFITRLNGKKSWTDEEIEAAWRIYQSNVKAGF